MKKTLILSIVVLVIIAGIMLTIVNIDMYTQIPKESDTATLSEITIINSEKKITTLNLDGYKEVTVNITDDIVFLTSDCKQLFMVTNKMQANSIKNGILENVEFRPTSHDIMKDILDNFGIEVKALKIEKLEAGTYFAKLILHKDDDVLILDIKPSDGIAIAVRTNASIYINEILIENQGRNIC